MTEPRPLPPLWGDAAIVTGLWALGGAQPLLDLLGRNPTFFVAAHASDARIISFVTIVLLIVPVVALALLAVSRRLPAPVPQLTRLILLGTGATLVGLSLGRRIWGDSTLGHLTITGAVVAVVLVADRRWPRVVEAMRYTAIAVVVFGGLFLVSPSGALIGRADASVATDVGVGKPDDVVLVILDELPTASLLDTDGEIAADRFPNFARLADTSTWYRNAVSDFTYTTEAVPAMLSGRVEESPPSPTGANYPQNLFTLLGARYGIEAREELTSLCPPDLCAAAEGSFGQMFSDAWVVLRHQTLPSYWRDDLPPVDQGWGGFESAGSTRADPLDDPFEAWTQRQAKVTSRTAYRTEPLETLADQLAVPSGARPELHAVHAVIPHLPWEREPGGALYTTSAESDVPVDSSGVWIRNEEAVTSSFQRHLLQVGHVDRLLGEILDSLDRSGRWDDTLLIVVADHGVTFTPGTHRRMPSDTTDDEVYHVPLFVHAPGGLAGEVRDDRVHNGDIMSTVVDALEVSTDWTFAGPSLLEPADGPARTTVQSRSGPRELDPSRDSLMAVVERNAQRLPEGFDWRSVAAPGDAGALVGAELSALATEDGTGSVVIDRLDQLTEVDRSSGFLPVMVEARFEGDRAPDQLLVAIDGTILGAGLPQAADGAYTTILDPTALRDGAHTVEVVAWNAGRLTTVEVDQGMGVTIDDGDVMVDGRVQPVIADRVIDLGLDRTNRVDGQIAVWGWSVDPEREDVPNLVILYDRSEVLATDSRFTRSSDAVDLHGEALEFSRFSLRGPELDDLKLAAIYDDGIVVRDL